MAKVTLARKKELSQPDEFITLSNRMLTYVRTNKKKIINTVTVVLIAVVGFAAYSYYVSQREEKAFIHLSKDMDWLEKSAKENPEAVSLEEVQKKRDVFLKSYSGTSASLLARASYAQLLFERGDYEGAVELYTVLVRNARQNDALRNIAFCALGESYEALNKPEQALENFKAILAGSNSLKKDEALFHMGMIYEAKGDSENSKKSFSRIVTEFPDSMYTDIARDKTAG